MKRVACHVLLTLMSDASHHLHVVQLQKAVAQGAGSVMVKSRSILFVGLMAMGLGISGPAFAEEAPAVEAAPTAAEPEHWVSCR